MPSPFLTSSLPLGGKVDKAKLWTNEGQPNNIQAFSRQKAALSSTRIPGFPVGEAVGFCRLKRSFFFFACLPLALRQAFPLPEKNSANFIFSAKMISLFHRLPLGGKLLAKQGDEGQPNNNQAFSRQKAALYSTRVPGFPVGEAVGFCRLKRSLHVFPLPEKKFGKLHFFRQKCEALPYVKPSPCLIVLAHNKAKIVSLVPRLPLGGEAPCKARW